MCYVYIGTCIPWMTIETKFSKLCVFCSLDEHLYAQLSKWVLWLLFVRVRLSCLLYLTLISLFLTGRTKKSWEKGINNHLTIVAPLIMYDICMLRHSKSVMSMTFVCLSIAKLECQILLGISLLSLISPWMIYLKEKYAKKNQKQKDKKCF